MFGISSVFLSIRKLFGYLVPGFAWVGLIVFAFPCGTTCLVQRFQGALPGTVPLTIALLVASYFLGGIGTVASFRILETLADLLDGSFSRLPEGHLRRVLQAISRRLHVFSFKTLEQEAAEAERSIADKLLSRDAALTAPGNDRWGIWKMYVLKFAPALAKEELEIEGEINFDVGMCFPSIVLGIWLWSAGHVIIGGGFLAVAVYFALRFQNLRHHEIIYITQAYAVARARHEEKENNTSTSSIHDESPE